MKWRTVQINAAEGAVRAVAPEIIAASRATDVPAFYAQWFMNRLRAGGATEMVERTADYMTGAQALYRSLDFRRAPEWDEVQRDGPPLLAFRRHL